MMDPTLSTKVSWWGCFFSNTTTLTPPSLQMQVGGVVPYLFDHRPHPCYKSKSVGLFLLQYDHTDPTLATNTSQWGHSLPFRPQTPPSLQKQVGGVISSPMWPHRPHPHYNCELVGSFPTFLTTTDPTLATKASRWGRFLPF